MSAAAEQAGELSLSEKLYAERRMDVDVYHKHSTTKEASRLISSISDSMKNLLLTNLLYTRHDEDLSGAIVDMQSDILTLMNNFKLYEMTQSYYDADLANMKRSQQRRDDRIGG